MAVANQLPSLEDEPSPAAATGTTQLLEHAILLLLFAGLVIGVLAVLRPFATAILFGTILAIAAWPLREFLLRCGVKRGLDATLLLLLALAVVVLPLLAVAPGLAERLTQGASRLQDYFASAPQAPSWLAGLPIVGDRLARIWGQAMLAEGGIRAFLDRRRRVDADEPDDPGRVWRLCRVWLPRPVHRPDTDRHCIHATRGLARRARCDASGIRPDARYPRRDRFVESGRSPSRARTKQLAQSLIANARDRDQSLQR